MDKRLNLVIAVQVAIFIVMIWCCRRPCQEAAEEEETSALANLVINHEDTASWLMFSNMFTNNVGTGTGKTTYWKGVLFQLGDYLEGNRDFNSVEFYKEGSSTPVLTLSAEDLTWAWVNVVSDRGSGVTPPVEDPDKVFSLYPNDIAVTPCSAIDRCADPATELTKPCVFCAGAEDVPCESPKDQAYSQCLRRTRIHAFQNPTHVLTYWEGQNGYEVSVEPDGDYNAVSFTFKDPFTVQVFGAVEEGDPLMVETADSAAGKLANVVRIVVTDKEGGPEGGKHTDPPWPPQTYP